MSDPNVIEMQCPVCKSKTALSRDVSGETRGDDRKFDHGKTMWDLLPYDQIEKIAEVMTHGCGKYGAESWKKVDKARYEAAFMRHYVAWKKGELLDKDSGIHPLAHCACNLIFIMWLEDHANSVEKGR